MANNTNSNLRIGVIGAGIVGLSTANLAQDYFPSAKVTVAADQFLTETTSDGAAGLFRPGLTFIGPNQEKTLKWLEDSYDVYNNLLVNDPEIARKAGIRRIRGYLLSSQDPELPKNYYLQKILPDFRWCSHDELEQFPGANYGTHCTTLLTECRRYLPYLTERFKTKGGIVMKWRVGSFEELADEYDIVFNCSAFGSKKLCNDHGIIRVRGQLFKVEAPWVDHFAYFDYNTYVIPGMDAVTLGGTRQFDDAKKEIDEGDSKGIYERCINLMPTLKKAKVLREWVGFRPYRGVVRVENETMNFPGLKSLKVVHNYGHGGYGVMSAPGTGKHAVAIASELLRARPTISKL